MTPKHHRARTAEGQWQAVPVLAYKQDGSAPFRDVTRQVLFEDPALACQLRYFEVAAGGHTTLERHEHVHAVMIVRGRGECMVGDEIFPIGMHDLVQVPSMTWHQFRAPTDETLGFLCLVNAERDRPQLPDAQDLAELRRDVRCAAFIRV